MTAIYTYLFCDLLTDRPITTLELADVSFERRIIQPGNFKASIPIPNREVAARVRKVFPPEDSYPPVAGPGRVICHVHRNGEIWGSYVIWQTTPSGDDRGRVKLDLQGASLESYLHHRTIWDDVSYPAQDQITIAHDLVARMQGASGSAGNVLLTTVGSASGVLQDRTYKGHEAATYGDRLAELANSEDGFEYYIRTYLDGSVRKREFVTGYPQLGNLQAPADMVFSRPGNIMSWSYSADATSAATRWQARGDTVNTDMAADSSPLVSPVVESADFIAVGWPYLDRTVDYQGVTDLSLLTGYARFEAVRRAGAVRIPQVTVRLDESTPLHPNRLGDYARVTIVDDWWPLDDEGRPGFAHIWRVVGFEITPPQRSNGQEQATLIFEENPQGDAGGNP